MWRPYHTFIPFTSMNYPPFPTRTPTPTPTRTPTSTLAPTHAELVHSQLLTIKRDEQQKQHRHAVVRGNLQESWDR